MGFTWFYQNICCHLSYAQYLRDTKHFLSGITLKFVVQLIDTSRNHIVLVYVTAIYCLML